MNATSLRRRNLFKKWGKRGVDEEFEIEEWRRMLQSLSNERTCWLPQ
jgi:hypothetical protein